jgi:hypothetical protein
MRAASWRSISRSSPGIDIVDDDATADDEVAQMRYRPPPAQAADRAGRNSADGTAPKWTAASSKPRTRTPLPLAQRTTSAQLAAARRGLKRTPPLGIDNVLFSVDWPYESNVAAVDFLKRQPLERHDIEKVVHLNAERVLRLMLSGSSKKPRRTDRGPQDPNTGANKRALK